MSCQLQGGSSQTQFGWLLCWLLCATGFRKALGLALLWVSSPALSRGSRALSRHSCLHVCCLGCTPQEIMEKICNNNYQDPVGEDCPEDLRKVIDRCRAFDPSQRPSAEGTYPGHLLPALQALCIPQSAAPGVSLPLIFHMNLPGFVFEDHSLSYLLMLTSPLITRPLFLL